MLNCGPGNACCDKCSGLGAYDPGLSEPNPRTFDVLKRYVENKVAAGEPFYISPELNSQALGVDGFGFLAAIIAAVASVAGTVASVAGTAAAIKSLKAGKATPAQADDVASQITPLVQAKLAAQGITLPGDVAQSATAAGILDSFGTENRPYVLAGIAAVGLLLVMRLGR